MRPILMTALVCVYLYMYNCMCRPKFVSCRHLLWRLVIIIFARGLIIPQGTQTISRDVNNDVRNGTFLGSVPLANYLGMEGNSIKALDGGRHMPL